MAENYSEHVSNLRRLAVTLQGVIAAADVMERIGSIENAIAEAERARIDALDRKHQAEEELESTTNAVARNNETAARTIADAETRAARLMADADTQAAQIVVDAKAEAIRTTENETTGRQTDLNLLLDEIERKRGELFTLRTQAETARGEAAAAEDARKESQTSLDAVLESIAHLQTPARK